jgi:hypothetical protein
MKFCKKGDKEGKHVHKIAREYTLIGAGRFRMNDVILEAGGAANFSSTAMFLLDPDHRSDEGDIRLSVAGA